VRGLIACGFVYRFLWSMAGVYGHGKAVRIGWGVQYATAGLSFY
jgi:hypothetical protein